MLLIEEFETSGRWLFRWRSYLPLILMLPWFASLGHFRYPFGSPLLDNLWDVLCLAVGGCGLLIRGLVAGSVPHQTSGRNTRRQVAESLNTTGMYSIVRNPLYLGNFLMGLAIALFPRVWWLPLIYLLSFMLYYERIVFTEEAFLRRKFGHVYCQWATITPVFIPKLSLWQRPSLPFSWRTLVRREYQSAFALVLVLFASEQLTELYLGHGWHVNTMWLVIMGLTTGGYLVARSLHKWTGLLRVAGR